MESSVLLGTLSLVSAVLTAQCAVLSSVVTSIMALRLNWAKTV